MTLKTWLNIGETIYGDDLNANFAGLAAGTFITAGAVGYTQLSPGLLLKTSVTTSIGDQTTASSTLTNIAGAASTVSPTLTSNIQVVTAGRYLISGAVGKTISIRVSRDGTNIGFTRAYDNPAGTNQAAIPFAFVDDDYGVVAGTHVYRAQVASNDNSTTVRAFDVTVSTRSMAA